MQQVRSIAAPCCNPQLVFRFVVEQLLQTVFNLMFVMSTGQHTTLHTDKFTDRIIRLCTSVALDGLSLMVKRVVYIVSVKFFYFLS